MTTLAKALELDQADELRALRAEFHFPAGPSGKPAVYLCGNSLGLQPKKAREYVDQELDDWARLGVEGHFHGRHPWLPYHELVTDGLARVMGAKPSEVVAMNSLTVNLHLMMVSFYRPTRERYRIVIEGGAFPSDQYAVASQARFHAAAVGFDPRNAVLELKPRPGEDTLRTEDILETIRREGSSIALVMLGGVNYLTGQAFDLKAIAAEARRAGAYFGTDLAHAAGNLKLELHDWNVDFAVWCSYKYLNSGPGGIAGAYVHEKHHRDRSLPRFEGWWGHDKKTRFLMGPAFSPIESVEAWQLSNPPILQLAALRASLELFDRATLDKLRAKSVRLTGYLESLLLEHFRLPAEKLQVITPRDPAQRGAQLSLRVRGAGGGKELLKRLAAAGVICDFREPDIVRAAPAPLYNNHEDAFRFAEALAGYARG